MEAEQILEHDIQSEDKFFNNQNIIIIISTCSMGTREEEPRNACDARKGNTIQKPNNTVLILHPFL